MVKFVEFPQELEEIYAVTRNEITYINLAYQENPLVSLSSQEIYSCPEHDV